MSMYATQLIKPTTHRRIQQEFDQKNYDLHKERLKSIKPSIDTTPPKIYPHVELKMKRLQLENDRLRQIENENRRLLKMLVQTAEKPTNKYLLNDDNYKNTSQQRRMKESLRIVGENERIVNRLINVKGNYDRTSLSKSFCEHETRMKNISTYNHPWRTNYNGDFSADDFLKVSLLTPINRRLSPAIRLKRSRSSDESSSSLPRIGSRRCSGSVVSDGAVNSAINNNHYVVGANTDEEENAASKET